FTTTYQVIAYSNNLCKNDTGYINIAIGNPPVVNAGNDINVASGTPVQLHATVSSNDVNKYLWSPATGIDCITCPDPQFIADNNITYKVTVQTIYGCTANDEVKVVVFCGKGQLFIPNAFTPNNDGLNDRFYIKGYGLEKIKRLQIFNRYGQKVFEKQNAPVNDPNYGWDGLVKGYPVEITSAFVYILEVICKDGQEFNMKGTLMLVR
ncbi:MAG: gliding motility-associated C-terminal domain-containing protein, partial [Ginsengibacter sp.]